jgi:hypothetical protein
MLWHHRMGNIREKGLQALHDRCMVKGVLDCNLEDDFFEHCIYGKKNWFTFPYGDTKKKGSMELIHSGVLGHVLIPSLGGSLYYVSFIDNFSRKTWIYFLRKKSKVFDKFKEFKSLVEN